MITQERALETLERFNIDQRQLTEWEEALGLVVPVDAYGNKLYSPLHINLFKNIKKHLALGRSLPEIRRMVVLPPPPQDAEPSPVAEAPAAELAPQPQPTPAQEVAQSVAQQAEVQQTLEKEFKNTLSNRLLKELRSIAPRTQTLPVSANGQALAPGGEANITSLASHQKNRGLKRFASSPVRITASSQVQQNGANAALLVLVDRLVEEKDLLQHQLVQMEKQKLHLHHVNEMFQQRVKELTAEIETLQDQLKARQNLKLIDDKTRLQKQVLEVEQRHQQAERQLKKMRTEIKELEASLATRTDPGIFKGNWLEEAELMQVAYDNFGINIETKRNRMFRLTQTPDRFFGHTAIVETTYDYQTNTLWKRQETLILNIINENRLEGEMIAEYILDGTPVAKAHYKVKCHRNGVKTD